MPPMKVRSTRYLQELRRRAKEFAGKSVGAKLIAPFSLRWWHWLEFGTALRGEDPALQRLYLIEPRNAKMLHWPNAAFPNDGESGHFAPFVYHPGIHPRRFIRDILGEIRSMAGNQVAAHIVDSGFTTSGVEKVLLDSVMPEVKRQIVESLRVRVAGTREDGRLQGRSAHEVFDAEVQIVPNK